MDEVQEIYVDKNEKFVASLGGGYISNFLKTGDISKGFCVVTDKRVYFNGSCYCKEGGRYTKSSEERIIDLKDITGSGAVHNNPVFLPLLGLACFFGGIFGVAGAGEDMFALFIFMGILLIIASVIVKKDIFSVEYAGGAIAFKASDYDKEEILQFQKALRMAKDTYVINNIENIGSIQQSVGTVADELIKYKELYDNGAITQEEFETLKKKIIG